MLDYEYQGFGDDGDYRVKEYTNFDYPHPIFTETIKLYMSLTVPFALPLTA